MFLDIERQVNSHIKGCWLEPKQKRSIFGRTEAWCIPNLEYCQTAKMREFISSATQLVTWFPYGLGTNNLSSLTMSLLYRNYRRCSHIPNNDVYNGFFFFFFFSFAIAASLLLLWPELTLWMCFRCEIKLSET